MKEKIKILFVIYYLGSGGAEKALINLLDMIDYERYQVDVLLFKQEGLYLDQLNPKANLLPIIPEFEKIDSNKKYIKWALKNGKPISALKKVYYFYCWKKGKNIDRQEWELCWSKIPSLKKEYDVAVGYMQGLPIRYVAGIVKAKVKFGWIHSEYEKISKNINFDRYFFQRLNYIISVSDKCTNSICKCLPEFKDKTFTLLNLMSSKLINEKANVGEGDTDKFDGIRLLSIGRLEKVKGYEMAIEACSILKQKGHKIRWNVIGIGGLKNELLTLIRQFNIEDCFILIGERSNPYPFIKQADIYVQTSLFEGKSVAIDEAKILRKAICVTNFNSVYDQLEHEKTAEIVEKNPQAIAAGIEKLIKNPDYRELLSQNLAMERDNSNEELLKHYELFERDL
ncbi:glycosyltransferase [Anaerosacchariphilus polymeriproducens]|uniref:Glycosyltransferase n=1 Tax=Anaerosacchariphilus polymeriproducens TaxID=1812858 RepID=A0A371AZ25_9FIRM|nr:glycosyltransferase [Anaerosacchariphilus polymeriproducens]RDU24799.1 glycosyltransferase [Anaerosacchariphilus polymeriproducens]